MTLDFLKREIEWLPEISDSTQYIFLKKKKIMKIFCTYWKIKKKSFVHIWNIHHIYIIITENQKQNFMLASFKKEQKKSNFMHFSSN